MLFVNNPLLLLDLFQPYLLPELVHTKLLIGPARTRLLCLTSCLPLCVATTSQRLSFKKALPQGAKC